MLNNVSTRQLNSGVTTYSRRPANEPIIVHSMVLAVKGLGELSWTVIHSFVGCADKSSWYSIHDMNVTLYGWTFKFYKVVRQQNSGVVEDFILPYSAVYLRIQRWKNYWNRSTFAKVTVKIKVAQFFWLTV